MRINFKKKKDFFLFLKELKSFDEKQDVQNSSTNEEQKKFK